MLADTSLDLVLEMTIISYHAIVRNWQIHQGVMIKPELLLQHTCSTYRDALTESRSIIAHNTKVV